MLLTFSGALAPFSFLDSHFFSPWVISQVYCGLVFSICRDQDDDVDHDHCSSLFV